MIITKLRLSKCTAILSMFVLAMTFLACGSKENETGSTESPKETETASVPLPEADKNDVYRELYTENAKLWDKYSYYMEVALSGGVYSDMYSIDESEMDLDSIKESMINGAEKDTDNSVLPVTGYEEYKPLDTSSVEIPEVAEDELDEKIESLTKQNALLTGEIAYIQNSALDNESSANPKEVKGAPTEEEMAKFIKEARVKKIKEAETIEEMLKLGGWSIISGSGDAVTARISTGEDTYTVETGDDSIRISSENIYGERSSLFGAGSMSGVKDAVAYMVSNGPNSIYTAGDFGLWWSY